MGEIGDIETAHEMAGILCSCCGNLVLCNGGFWPYSGGDTVPAVEFKAGVCSGDSDGVRRCDVEEAVAVSDVSGLGL